MEEMSAQGMSGWLQLDRLEPGRSYRPEPSTSPSLRPHRRRGCWPTRSSGTTGSSFWPGRRRTAASPSGNRRRSPRASAAGKMSTPDLEETHDPSAARAAFRHRRRYGPGVAEALDLPRGRRRRHRPGRRPLHRPAARRQRAGRDHDVRGPRRRRRETTTEETTTEETTTEETNDDAVQPAAAVSVATRTARSWAASCRPTSRRDPKWSSSSVPTSRTRCTSTATTSPPTSHPGSRRGSRSARTLVGEFEVELEDLGAPRSRS